MTHGILYDTRVKHNDIITMFTQHPEYLKSEAYRANYKFVYDIYSEVAKEYGIVLPKTWVIVDQLAKSDTHIKSGRFLMEPLGPVIKVNYSFNPLQFFYGSQVKGNVLHTANWYEQAKHFFMVNGSAKSTLETNSPHSRNHLLCERWRAKSFYLIYK